RRLFESRPWQRLVPDQGVMAGDAGSGAGHQRAARASDGSFLFAYTPLWRPLSVRLDRLSGTVVRAYWFDPRTGIATEIGTFPRSGTRTFDPPENEERGNDWVLVLDDADTSFPQPGMRRTQVALSSRGRKSSAARVK
ncbi:MAG TPA: putative collagen-binding domain-containing protein, partial [Longimicrobiaceae bacterium]|nr:putative collagen-binding domain-containing protein [Longimicrobiaceae bacterium]